MARYDLSDTAWALLLPIIPPERSRRAGHPYTEHRKVINGMAQVRHGVTYLNDMAPGKRYITGLTAGLRPESLILFSTGYLPFRMLRDSSTGQQSLWTAAMSEPCDVLPVLKKTP